MDVSVADLAIWRNADAVISLDSSSNCRILLAIDSSRPWKGSTGNLAPLLFGGKSDVVGGGGIAKSYVASSMKFCALVQDLAKNSRLDLSRDFEDSCADVDADFPADLLLLVDDVMEMLEMDDEWWWWCELTRCDIICGTADAMAAAVP